MTTVEMIEMAKELVVKAQEQAAAERESQIVQISLAEALSQLSVANLNTLETQMEIAKSILAA